MIQKRAKILFVFLIFLSCALFIESVFAAKTFGDTDSSAFVTVAQATGLEQTDALSMAGKVIRVALSVSAIIFFTLMIYAGFVWMTARGEEESIKKARNTIIAAVIGLVILISGYAITQVVQTNIVEKPNADRVYQTSPDQVGPNETLGCCIDWVGKSNMEVEIGGIRACRMDTLSNCQAVGNDPNNPDDRVFGGGKWIFHAEWSKLDQCLENCNNG